jgi:hypothetical protein
MLRHLMLYTPTLLLLLNTFHVAAIAALSAVADIVLLVGTKSDQIAGLGAGITCITTSASELSFVLLHSRSPLLLLLRVTGLPSTSALTVCSAMRLLTVPTWQSSTKWRDWSVIGDSL